jgi:hypothetical protein
MRLQPIAALLIGVENLADQSPQIIKTLIPWQRSNSSAKPEFVEFLSRHAAEIHVRIMASRV